MSRANSRESGFVRAVLRVICEQPNFRISAADLVGRSICFDDKIEIHSAKTPFGDFVTAQSVCKSEGVFLRKRKRCVSRNSFVLEEQPDALTIVIQERSTNRQLTLCPQPIRVCKMGGAGDIDLL